MKRPLAVILAVAMVVEFMFLGPVLAQPQTPPVEAPPEAQGALDEEPAPLDDDLIQEVLPDAIPANTRIPARYHHDDFTDKDPLSPWSEDRLLGDEQGTSLWQVLPTGRDEGPAATLADAQEGTLRLPGWTHQALISPTIDLTSVPNEGLEDHNEQAARIADRAADMGTDQANPALEDAGAPHGFQAEELPRAPARLVVDHAFAFPDETFEDGSAESGFTIEARAPGSEWVPLEPATGMQTARPATSVLLSGLSGATGLASIGSTGVQLQDPGSMDAGDGVGAGIGGNEEGVDGDTVPDPGILPSVPTLGLVDAGPVAVAVDDGCVVAEHDQRTIREGTLPMIIPGFTVPEEIRESVCLDPQTLLEQGGDETGTATPRERNAHVAPLDARGYTGTSDRTQDGDADFVRHTFDLSPWAGSEVEIRFRAGTSNADAPGAFWAIDDVRVESISHAANLRVSITAPGEGHLAAPGEPFPLKASVQNVGQLEQEGPFEVDVSIQGPVETWTKTLTINGTLGFLESATGEVTFIPTSQAGYDVAASIESTHPDGDPQDDEDHDTLPVGVDDTVRLQVHRDEPVLEDGDVLQGAVSVENQGNVPLEGTVDVRLHPYDPTSGGPTGEGIPLIQEPAPVLLPANERLHPMGVKEPTAQIPFEGAVTEGSHLVVARLGDAIATAPIGANAPPPPVFEDSFDQLTPGPTSFEVGTGTGTWEIRAESDVREGLVYAPFERTDDGSSIMDVSKLDPGAVEEQGAWVPSAHESLVLTPTDQDRLLDIQDGEGDGLFAESPRSPVSVSVLAHEVDLRGTKTAVLDYLSALSIPPGQMGATEVQVFVQPRGDATHPLVDDLRSIATHYAGEASGLADVHEEEACLGERIREATGEDVGVELCLLLGSGITDPCKIGVQGQAEGTACLASAPRWDALAPLAGGDLVHQQIEPQAWDKARVDLSAYTGSIVDIAFVFISEADEAELRYAGTGNPSSASYETPQRLGSMFLLDQVRVFTDQGARLDPAERSMAKPIERAVHEVTSVEPEEGWRSLGYAYMTGLGPSHNPVRSQAQLLEGQGRPAAVGADAGTGLVIGSEDSGDQGINLHKTNIQVNNDAEEEPHPAAQPAVTVLTSPSIDLGGLETPLLSFDQRFNLQATFGQKLTEPIDGGDILDAFSLPDGTCGIEDDDEVDSLTGELRCALSAVRSEDPRFDIATGTTLEDLQEPSVPAGMFLRVSTKTPTGWSTPVPVVPDQGYRYPAGDDGGFQPVLDYDITWNDATGTEPSVSQLQSFFDSETVSPSRFNGQHVWAGDTDTNGDGTPNWVASDVDLSPWAGEEIRLEFVLTARTADEHDGVQGEPWSIDNVIVGEAESPGRITLDELTWPSEDLPVLDPEHPLPVRVSATTPTGLDAPVHTTALLQDADGCIQATQTGQTRFLDDSGRATPMPAGANVDTEIVFPPEDIQGPGPWQVHIAADSARTPTIPTPADATLQATSSLPRQGPAYDVQAGGTFEASITAPTCQPQPQAQLVFHNPSRALVQAPSTPEHDNGDIQLRVDEAVWAGPAGAEDPPEALVDRLPQGIAGLIVTEGTGADAGIDTVLLRTSEDAVPIDVRVDNDRLSPQTPVKIQVQPTREIHGATVELVPLGEGERVQAKIGSLSPIEPHTEALTPTTEGPHLVTVVGTTANGDPAMGIASLVAAQAAPVTDPILEQRTASLTVSEGSITNLRIQTASADPFQGLSTETRTVTTVLENPGTTMLEGLEVAFLAQGQTIGTEQVGTLLPGEERTVSTVYTPLSGSTTLQVRVTGEDEVEASRTVAVKALQDLGALRPNPQEGVSEGWRVDQDRVMFQNEDGNAPRDTVGTLPLEGQPLPSLADFSVVLQHDMDMEEGFDGGQALIQDAAGDIPGLASERLQEMSPFSPVQGEALTGTFAEETELSAHTAPLFELDEDLSLLTEQDAPEMLKEVWQRAGDTDTIDDIDETLISGETCEGVDHPDEPQAIVDEGAWCQWVKPKVPYPSHRSDVWLLHVGPILAEENTMGSGGNLDRFRVGALTQYLFLETDDLVTPAQEAGTLSVTFDEARILGGVRGDEQASIEVCASFIAYDDDHVEEHQERRCSGLEHGEPFNGQRDWGESTLRIPDVPAGSFDVIRLEFSLRNADFFSTINDPLQGWFIGPVTATAGQAQETWTPDEDIYEIDPTDRTGDVIEQSGLIRVAGGLGPTGDEDPVDSGTPEKLSQAIPIIPWAPGHDHAWVKKLDDLQHIHDVYEEAFLDRARAVPYQLGLACPEPFEFDDDADDPECILIEDPGFEGLGMGAQVLGNNGPEHPLIERTRSTQLTAEDDGRLTFEPHKKGYNLDYRLVTPIDLRGATERAEALLDMDKSGAIVTLALRSQGTDVWEPIEVCHVDEEDCNVQWTHNDQPARVDLSRFVGDIAELGIRIQAPANAGIVDVDVDGITVHGGVLSMIEGDLALNAWTDTSVEGQGWVIDDARLFGRTLGANVGVHAYDSPLAVEDASVLDGESIKERVHVHIDDFTSSLQLQTYNQGPEPRTVDVTATYQDASECEVSLEPSEITLAPFSTEWHDIEFTMETFRDEVDDEFKESTKRDPKIEDCGSNGLYEDSERLQMIRVEIEPLDGVEEEATGDDNAIDVPLLLDPFGLAKDRPYLDGHERGVQATEIDISPTRPDRGETVWIEATVVNVDTDDASFNADVRLFNSSAEPGEDPWVHLDASAMAEGVTSLESYEEAHISWPYDALQEWEEATLVEVQIGDIVRQGWMYAPDEVHGERLNVKDGSDQAPEDGETLGSSILIGPGRTSGPGSFEELPPPLVGIEASWETPPPDAHGYAESGWALQACLVPPDEDPDVDPCPDVEDPDAERNHDTWVTLNVVHAPEDTVATINPNACPIDEGNDTWGDEHCDRSIGTETTARETWANVAGGKTYDGERVDVLAGISPNVMEDDLVLFSLTDCSLAGDWDGSNCPDWTTQDRFEKIQLRAVIFHDGDSDMRVNIGGQKNDLTNGSSPVPPNVPDAPAGTVTPIAPAPSQTPTLPPLSFIPEAKTKALSFSLENMGTVGARGVDVDASLSEEGQEERWTVTTEGFTDRGLVEPGEEVNGRVLVESPISPAGTSLGTVIETEINPQEIQDLGASFLIPVQTQPGDHPNLVADHVRIPDDVTVGEEVTVEVSVRNAGTATSQPVPLSGIARYDDGVVDPLETVDEFEHVPSLPPGGQTLAVLKWTPSEHGDATLRVAVGLDTLGPIAGPTILPWEGQMRELQTCTLEACPNVAESNARVEPPALVDLAVDVTIHDETPLIVGEPVDIEFTVENHGPAEAPQYETRLLAGVVSLLEDDPLIPEAPLPAGERWSTTATLIPARSGDLRLTASAFSDEAIVQERRDLRNDGTLAIADNTHTQTVPVIARGLDTQTPSIVDAASLFDEGHVRTNLNVTNRGTTTVHATVSALGDDIAGTLVSPNGTLTPSVHIEPGETLEGTLQLTFEDIPNAGRHPVHVQVTSDQGSAHETLDVDVPVRPAWSIDTAHLHATEPTLPIHVPVTNQGNHELTLRVGTDAQGLDVDPVRASLEPQETRTVALQAHVTGAVQDGTVWAAGPGDKKQAPLNVEAPQGAFPTLLSASVNPQEGPALVIQAANPGTDPTVPQLTVTHDNETIEQTRFAMDPGEETTVTIPINGEPGEITVHLEDGDIASTRTLTTEDLRPRVLVDGLRVTPPSPHEGDRVQVRATLANHGPLPATVTPALFVDGEVHQALSEPVTVEPDEPRSVRFTWQAQGGERALAVSADPFKPDVVDEERGMMGTAVNVTTGFFTQGGQLDGAQTAQNPVPAPGVALVLALIFSLAWAASWREHG